MISGNTLFLHGKNVPLLSGEVQFFRMDPETWELCLRQVKNIGLPIVSTYLSWRRFSKSPGQFDLTGLTDTRLNVPKFLDLCKKMDLYVTMKPGPWICGEEVNGGYPDWLVEQPDLQVLDVNDQPVSGYRYPFDSPIPSYFHPSYQFNVSEWLKAVDEVIKPYCYPNGPIILIQLDNEPCYTFHDRMFESDYNPTIAEKGGLYSRWMKEKYRSIERLNHCYGLQFREFAEVTPPRKLNIKMDKQLVQYMDWVEFKEDLLASHVASIRNYHLQNGVDEVLFTINFNQHPQLATPNNWHSLERSSGLGGFDYYPEMPMNINGFVDVVQAVNYSRAVNRVAWSPEIMCGIWSFDGDEHRPDSYLDSKEYEYLYLTCLAYGLKGMNFYMLADRDNWVNSPIDSQGLLTKTANAVISTIQIMQKVPSFYDLNVDQSVGVLFYHTYARMAFISNEMDVKVDGNPLDQAYEVFDDLFARLIEANINPGLIDPDVHPEDIQRFQLVFAPMNHLMDLRTQQILLEYVVEGGTLVCFPELPENDWDGSKSELLKNSIMNKEKQVIGGWISTQLGKGQLIEINHKELTYEMLRELLNAGNVKSTVTIKDTRVKSTLQTNEKGRLFFFINTANEEILTDLEFSDIQFGAIKDVFLPEENLQIKQNRSSIRIKGRSVKAYWKEPG